MKRYYCSIALITVTFGLAFSQVKLGEKVPNFTATGSGWIQLGFKKAT